MFFLVSAFYCLMFLGDFCWFSLFVCCVFFVLRTLVMFFGFLGLYIFGFLGASSGDFLL